MSRENVELVRAQYERWNAEEFEAWIEGFDPEVEYGSSVAASTGVGEYRGHEGMRRFVSDYFDDWEYFRLEPSEYFDDGPNVVVVMRAAARGRRSGVQIDGELAHVWTFRGRRAIRHQSFGSRAEALEAVGLRE